MLGAAFGFLSRAYRSASSAWGASRWTLETIKKAWTESNKAMDDLQEMNLRNWRSLTGKGKRSRVPLPPVLQLRSDWGQFKKAKAKTRWLEMQSLASQKDQWSWIPITMVWQYQCRVRDTQGEWQNLVFAYNLIELTRQAIVVNCLQGLMEGEGIGEEVPIMWLNPVTQEPYSSEEIKDMSGKYAAAYRAVKNQATALEKAEQYATKASYLGFVPPAVGFVPTAASWIGYSIAIPALLATVLPYLTIAAIAFSAIALTTNVASRYIDKVDKLTFDGKVAKVREAETLFNQAFPSLEFSKKIRAPGMEKWTALAKKIASAFGGAAVFGHKVGSLAEKGLLSVPWVTVGGVVLSMLINQRQLRRATPGQDIAYSRSLGRVLHQTALARREMLTDNLAAKVPEELCAEVATNFNTSRMVEVKLES